MSMLHEMLKKKKPDKNLDPNYKKAKMGVLKDIHDMAKNDMGEELKGMKKVTVASPDEEGLKMGLAKAKELVDEHGDDLDKEDPSEAHKHEEEDAGHETVHGDAMSDDEASEHEEHDGSPAKPAAEHMLEESIDHESAEGELSDSEIEDLINLLNSKRKKS